MTDRRRVLDEKAKSESVTPLPEDEDDDAPRRSTRAKNPLPPSSGPLFPPLPPKQPRPSRSPRFGNAQVKVKEEVEHDDPRPRPGPVTDGPVEGSLMDDLWNGTGESNDDAVLRNGREDADVSMEEPVAEVEPAIEPVVEQEAEQEAEQEQDLGMEVNRLEQEQEQEQEPAVTIGETIDEPPTIASPLSTANLEAATNPDDWESYRRHRGVRGFGAASSTSSTSERKTRRRRGEEQLLVAEYLAAPDADAPEGDGEGEGEGESEGEGEGEEEEEEDRGDVTRCVCGREDIDEMMIQCDQCNVWQHGACVGIWGDNDAPDEYFCELCKPALHMALRRYIEKRSKLPFIQPTPNALLDLHRSSDYRPSQSERWPKPARKATSRRYVSPVKRKASPSRSISPAAAKRRSTMNSRDSAYEAAVKIALEASKAEAAAANAKPASSAKDKEKEKEKESKKAAAAPSLPDASFLADDDKPKHPNQYTYRPKVVSPVKPTSKPAPPPPPVVQVQVHEHGTRRNGPKEANPSGWNLPDHLTPFADLLPSPSPISLLVRTPATLPTYGRNHFHNLRYGPFDDDTLPVGPPDAPVAGPSWHLEPPVKPKYPLKRVTLAEMKKRVRSVLEYVGRLQSDEARRAERAKLLKLDGEGPSPPEPPERVSVKANQLMDELTRELITFQETFGAGLAPSALANVVGLGIAEDEES